MKTLFQVLILVIFLVVIGKAEDAKKYGKEIELEEKTKISAILENVDEFLGKEVLVEGLVVNVCKKRGCWIELASDKEFETIRVKVKDGEIIFPMEAKGKTALVEGEFYSFNVEMEHKCDHGKEEGCGHKEGEHAKMESQTMYQIKGLGAVIK